MPAKAKTKGSTKKGSAKKPAKKVKAAKLKKDGTAKKARAKNAFMYFSIENRPKIVAENPDLSFGEIGKEIGKQWREIKAADRKKYDALSAKDKARVAKLNAE